MNTSPTVKKTQADAANPFQGVAKLFRGILESYSGVTPEVKARFTDETRCRRCGKCCHGAIRVKDRMVMLRDLPCKYLSSTPDGLAVCSVYTLRELTGWCHRMSADSIRKELYPPHCPYVEGVANYQGKIELSDAEFEEVKPILVKIFTGFPRPEYVRKSDWDRFRRETLQID